METEKEEKGEETEKKETEKKETEKKLTARSGQKGFDKNCRKKQTLCFQIGRICYINYGPFAGKICCILDFVDTSQALVSGPITGVPRHKIPFKRLSVTPLKLNVVRTPRTATLIKQFKAGDIIKKWSKLPWARKIQRREKRDNLGDFQRFQVMVLKKNRSRLIRQEYKRLNTIDAANRKAGHMFPMPSIHLKEAGKSKIQKYFEAREKGETPKKPKEANKRIIHLRSTGIIVSRPSRGLRLRLFNDWKAKKKAGKIKGGTSRKIITQPRYSKNHQKWVPKTKEFEEARVAEMKKANAIRHLVKKQIKSNKYDRDPKYSPEYLNIIVNQRLRGRKTNHYVRWGKEKGIFTSRFEPRTEHQVTEDQRKTRIRRSRSRKRSKKRSKTHQDKRNAYSKAMRKLHKQSARKVKHQQERAEKRAAEADNPVPKAKTEPFRKTWMSADDYRQLKIKLHLDKQGKLRQKRAERKKVDKEYLARGEKDMLTRFEKLRYKKALGRNRNKSRDGCKPRNGPNRGKFGKKRTAKRRKRKEYLAEKKEAEKKAEDK